MLAIKDLNGEVHLLTGAFKIVRKRRVNGEKELSLQLKKTKQNSRFFDNIDKLWRIIDFNGEEYPILLYRDVAEGKGYVREFNCIHSFFDDMRNHFVYDTFSSSKTFDDMMAFIFNGSGYQYNIIGQFYAREFENFGDDFGLELFKTALDRYIAEFYVDGTMVNLRTRIGNTTDFQYRHKFNLESIERSVDALDFSTYGEGFGKDGLHVTYTSPLAEIYGIRPIKAIRDERYTDPESLTNRIKEAVDNSLKITLTVKLSDLRASGYNKNHPNEGDTIILVDGRLGLKVDVRIVEIVELLSKSGKVIDCDVTLSNFSNVFEQQRRIHNATKTLADAIDGKRPLPFEALSIAVQQATITLQNAQTELVFPVNGGIMAVDKDNPNEIVLYNSKGLGVSDDGGQTFKTAVTGKGFVADLVTVGTMLFDRLRGGTAWIGGPGNGDGELIVTDESGEEAIANFNRNGGFVGNLSVETFINDQVVYRNKDTRYYYVDPLNGNDDNSGLDWANAKKTIMSVIDALPKFNQALVTIYVHYDNGDNVNENLHLESFHGQGDIVIDFQTTNNKLNGYIYLRGNTNFISIRNVTMSTTDARNSAVEADRCSLVDLRYVKVYGNNLTPYAFHGIASNVMLYNCDMYDVTYDGIRAGHLADMWFQNCAGLAGSSGLVAVDGGEIKGNGFAPGGNAYNIYESRGGDVAGTFTVNLGAATPPPAPDTTQEFTADSGMNWDVGGNFWDTIDLFPRQGNYGYGRKSGFWFFGTKLDVLVGKTIKSMSVYVRRKSAGGVYDPAPIQIRWHGHKTKPTTPADEDQSSEYVQANLNAGDYAWVTIPSSWFPYFQNGSAKGIGCYIASDAKTDYANMEVGAKIKVTYS